jgi:hypothetical protein
MSKDAFEDTIRFRAPAELKEKLTAIAARRTQDLSEYLRQRCLDIVEEFELQHPDFFEDVSDKSHAAKAPRRKARRRGPTPPLPDHGHAA